LHGTAFLSFNPCLSLKLGIDNKRISGARRDNGSIFKRNSISGETFSLPSSLNRKVRENE